MAIEQGGADNDGFADLATSVNQTTIIAALGGNYDYFALTEGATTDTWVYKSGGSGGTTVKTKVITYTDSGKGTISNITIT